MDNPNRPVDIKAIAETSPDYQAALHLAAGVQMPRRSCAPAAAVARLLAAAKRDGLRLDLLFGAYEAGRLIAACLGVESPGAAALALVSGDAGREQDRQVMVALLQALQSAAWRRSIVLLEALTDPDQPSVARAISEAGFRHLTQLVYLERGLAPGNPVWSTVREEPLLQVPALSWTTYTPKCAPLFANVIARTYVQSLDCPELTGLRRAEDVLAGHRATGIFEPDLWMLASRAGVPAGLILLNRIAVGRALELVYMGVVPEARGLGVGDALLQRGLEAATAKGARVMALAVDERNGPARRLYRRWGFKETATRDAWIVSPPAA
jgi:ribosomal protein S18 acetylase RimI-like enzyme